MMGHKTVEPKLYMSFSLDAAVPANYLVRRLAAVVDFDFVRGLVRRDYSHTGQPSVGPNRSLQALAVGLPLQHHERAPALRGSVLEFGLAVVRGL